MEPAEKPEPDPEPAGGAERSGEERASEPTAIGKAPEPDEQAPPRRDASANEEEEEEAEAEVEGPKPSPASRSRPELEPAGAPVRKGQRRKGRPQESHESRLQVEEGRAGRVAWGRPATIQRAPLSSARATRAANRSAVRQQVAEEGRRAALVRLPSGARLLSALTNLRRHPRAALPAPRGRPERRTGKGWRPGPRPASPPRPFPPPPAAPPARPRLAARPAGVPPRAPRGRATPPRCRRRRHRRPGPACRGRMTPPCAGPTDRDRRRPDPGATAVGAAARRQRARAAAAAQGARRPATAGPRAADAARPAARRSPPSTASTPSS